MIGILVGYKVRNRHGQPLGIWTIWSDLYNILAFSKTAFILLSSLTTSTTRECFMPICDAAVLLLPLERHSKLLRFFSTFEQFNNGP